MLKVDLITGFLGAGKTTFISSYLRWLQARGLKAAVIENEFGGADVDTVLLKNEGAEVRSLTGVCMCCKGKDMFKNMLLSAASDGCDRILVEPSGIYDVDEFFSVMMDPIVSRSCSIGSILTLCDATVNEKLSAEAEYICFSQLLAAGRIIFSKFQFASAEEIQNQISHLNRLMQNHGCSRILTDADFLIKDWADLSDSDYESLMNAGWQILDHRREELEHEALFQAYCYANYCRDEKQLTETIRSLFADDSHGIIFRVKGHIRDLHNQWYEINCTRDSFSLKKVTVKRGLFAVIGQELDEPYLKGLFLSKAEAKALMQE